MKQATQPKQTARKSTAGLTPADIRKIEERKRVAQYYVKKNSAAENKPPNYESDDDIQFIGMGPQFTMPKRPTPEVRRTSVISTPLAEKTSRHSSIGSRSSYLTLDDDDDIPGFPHKRAKLMRQPFSQIDTKKVKLGTPTYSNHPFAVVARNSNKNLELKNKASTSKSNDNSIEIIEETTSLKNVAVRKDPELRQKTSTWNDDDDFLQVIEKARPLKENTNQKESEKASSSSKNDENVRKDGEMNALKKDSVHRNKAITSKNDRNPMEEARTSKNKGLKRDAPSSSKSPPSLSSTPKPARPPPRRPRFLQEIHDKDTSQLTNAETQSSSTTPVPTISTEQSSQKPSSSSENPTRKISSRKMATPVKKTVGTSDLLADKSPTKSTPKPSKSADKPSKKPSAPVKKTGGKNIRMADKAPQKKRKSKWSMMMREMASAEADTGERSIPKTTFRRVVVDIFKEKTPHLMINKKAVDALHVVCEMYSEKLFMLLKLFCQHANRKTIMMDDLRLLRLLAQLERLDMPVLGDFAV